jgi:hypothetical protein
MIHVSESRLGIHLVLHAFGISACGFTVPELDDALVESGKVDKLAAAERREVQAVLKRVEAARRERELAARRAGWPEPKGKLPR